MADRRAAPAPLTLEQAVDQKTLLAFDGHEPPALATWGTAPFPGNIALGAARSSLSMGARLVLHIPQDDNQGSRQALERDKGESGTKEPPVVILSVAKDQVGRPESTTLGMLAVRGTLLSHQGESSTGH
jgi:hypothetical protein